MYAQVEHSIDAPTITQMQKTGIGNHNDADAIVLDDRTDIRYLDYYTIEYNQKKRIKILTNEGINQIDTTSECIVFNLINDSIVCTTRDNISVGSIVDITHHWLSNDYLNIEAWMPECELPVESALLTLVAPKDYQLNFEIQNREGLRIAPVENMVVMDSKGNSFDVCRYEYERRYIEPFKPNKYIFCADDYKFKIKPHFVSANFPNGDKKIFASTWEEVDHELINNNLLYQFLHTDNLIGITARKLEIKNEQVKPVLLRRRSTGKIEMQYPNANVFNDIILAVINKGDTTYIDPNKPDSIAHLLTKDQITINARFIDISKDNEVRGQWINLFKEYEYNNLINTDITIDTKGNISGSSKSFYRGLALLEHNLTSDTCFINMQCNIKDDTLSFSPFIDIAKRMDIPDVNTKFPIEYPYTIKYKQIINIDVDDSFDIVQLPKGGIFVSENLAYYCQINVILSKQRISIVFTLQRNVLKQLPSAHPFVEYFYKELLLKFNDQVLLKRR